MQLDRVPPPAALPEAASAQLSGTIPPSDGVESADMFGAAPLRRALSWRGGLAVLAGAFSLLGQGERARVDSRFVSPSSTLATYWSALRDDDVEGASECLVDGGDGVPEPGTLWFLPPTSDLTLTSFRTLSVTSSRLLVRYEVRYHPRGSRVDLRFETGNELVREHGEWRIARGIGEASMPEWKPIPRTVDI